MGAAVTKFFKGLGDHMAGIEMPQLPRIVSPMARLTDVMNSRVAGRDMAGARFVPQNESSVDPQTFGVAMSTLSKITYRDGEVPGGQLVSDWNAQTYQSLMQAPDNDVQRTYGEHRYGDESGTGRLIPSGAVHWSRSAAATLVGGSCRLS